MAGATRQGLVIVLTGDGKGKTTSALGMAMRAVGSGLRVVMVQFIKARQAGEDKAAARLAPRLQVHRKGLGFVPPIGSGPIQEHQAAAREALELVRGLLCGRKHAMVIADEILTAIGLGLVSADDVLGLLEDRPAAVHLVLTGCGAPQRIIDRADLVTEMRLVKHPHQKGLEAQEGIEF
jgi:cob(I)alamin adenosyltransferase